VVNLSEYLSGFSRHPNLSQANNVRNIFVVDLPIILAHGNEANRAKREHCKNRPPTPRSLICPSQAARLVRGPRAAQIRDSAENAVKEEIMDGQSADLQQGKEEVLIYSVSDEALEAAAAILKEQVGSFTLSFCSGLDTCPT
jgi:hypothetical protein